MLFPFQICSWEFCARRHEELIPRRLLIPQVCDKKLIVERLYFLMMYQYMNTRRLLWWSTDILGLEFRDFLCLWYVLFRLRRIQLSRLIYFDYWFRRQWQSVVHDGYLFLYVFYFCMQISQLGAVAQKYQAITQNATPNLSVPELQSNCNMWVRFSFLFFLLRSELQSFINDLIVKLLYILAKLFLLLKLVIICFLSGKFLHLDFLNCY